jgi:hypothetical protein
MSEEDDAFYELLRTGGELEPPSDDYARFDEREDILASMELLELITPLLGRKPALWKWAIIGAQSALQGAMVCALADTTGTSVLTPKSGGKLLDWLQSDDPNRGPPPKERLAEFGVLLEKAISAGLVLTEEQEKDIRRMHDYFRNRFSHFIPMGWGIQKAGLPPIIEAALDAVEKLMNSGRAAVHLDGPDRRRFEWSLRNSRIALASIGIPVEEETDNLKKPRPLGWTKPKLPPFLESMWGNAIATFSKRSEAHRLCRIDDLMFEIATDWKGISPTIENMVPLMMFFRAHSAFRGACGLGMGGMTVEGMAVLRLSLDFVGYACLLKANPSLATVWWDRDIDEKSLKEARREFAGGAVVRAVKKVDQRLGEIYEMLYDRTIQFGGHPNEKTVTQSLKLDVVARLTEVD